MKATVFICIIFMSAFLANCQQAPETQGVAAPAPVEVVTEESSSSSTQFTGSECKGNYVWGGAMNLAWNELAENIIGEKIAIASSNPKANETADALNNAPFSKKDLDEASYYIKSGYGQATVDLINKESKKKFPTKSFPDLDLKLAPDDIISYAYFLKQIEYAVAFTKQTVKFEGSDVKGFAAATPDQKQNVKVLSYQNDDKFVIAIRLKDESDQIILAKGYDMQTPDEVVASIQGMDITKAGAMRKADSFTAACIKLDYHREYKELLGVPFANPKFASYQIAEMFENIKFDMDEKGARVENEAVIVATKSMDMDEPRKFLLDKPYWIVMKRTDSKNPYFLLGVRNTELMSK